MEQRLIALIRAYEQDLLKMCMVYLRDTGLAQDAVQETFFKAYRGLAAFRGDSGEKTWLMRIAINVCKDIRRSAWMRHVDRRVGLEGLPEPIQPCGEDASLLTLEVMRLPRREMEAVLLFYYQGMNLREAALTLGISESTVSKRLTRARDRLRIALEGGGKNERA